MRWLLTLSTRRPNYSKLPTFLQPSEASLDKLFGDKKRPRFRTTGYRQIIEVHLLFPHLTSVSEAHRLATILEERLPAELGMPAEVMTHLESSEDHADVLREQHYTGKPK